MKLSIAEIKEVLFCALIKRNLSEEMASIIAEDYLAGELEGKESHGLMAFQSLLRHVDSHNVRRYDILEKRHAFILVNANKLHGSYVGRKIADVLIEMAKTEGVAVGFIKNMKKEY